MVLPDGRRSPCVAVHPAKNSLVCTPKPRLGVINFPCPTLLCGEAVLVNTELSQVSLFRNFLSIFWAPSRDELPFSKRSGETCWVCVLCERGPLRSQRSASCRAGGGGLCAKLPTVAVDPAWCQWLGQAWACVCMAPIVHDATRAATCPWGGSPHGG